MKCARFSIEPNKACIGRAYPQNTWLRRRFVDGGNHVAGQAIVVVRIVLVYRDLIAVVFIQAILGPEPDKPFLVLKKSIDRGLGQALILP